MSVNRITLVGRLGQDPEMKQLSNGEGVCHFTLATGEKWKDKKSGNMMEKTQWHRISAFGKVGELCHQFLKKGHQCYLEGKMDYSTYDKDGVTHYSTQVIANTVQFLESKKDGEANTPKASLEIPPGVNPKTGEYIDPSDIPF